MSDAEEDEQAAAVAASDKGVWDLTGDEPVYCPEPEQPRKNIEQPRKKRKTGLVTANMRLAYWKTGHVPEGVTNWDQNNVDFLSRGQPRVSLCKGMVLAVVRTGVPFWKDPCTCSWMKKHFRLPVQGWIRFFQAREYCEKTDKMLWNFVDIDKTFENFDSNSVSLLPFDMCMNASDAQFWAQASSAYFYVLQADASKPVQAWVPDPHYHSRGAASRIYYHVSCIQTCKEPAPHGTVWLSTRTPKCDEYEKAQETNKVMKEQLEYANAGGESKTD